MNKAMSKVGTSCSYPVIGPIKEVLLPKQKFFATIRSKKKKIVDITPLSDQDRELLSGKTIVEQFPYIFPVTNFVLTSFSGKCSQCRKSIPEYLLFGRMSPSESSQTLDIEARGYCPDCKLVTRYSATVNSAGCIQWLEAGQKRSETMVVEHPAKWFQPYLDALKQISGWLKAAL